ncbi:electron transfer flavoprotein subunit alpha/FixB family protein, partial [Xanthomonas citri pv. citri]|nr:electron transfer flavoprotein subunit alpha/FixB family protein [Xanthomonas citri pv. citri]
TTLTTNYTHIFNPSTTFNKNLIPYITTLLNINQISNLITIKNNHNFKHPIYTNNTIITIKIPTNQIIITTIHTTS